MTVTFFNPYRFAAAGVTDSFNRADSAVSLGSADTGQAWSALSGTWGIASNRAYSVTAGADDVAVVDAGMSDGTVTVTAAVANAPNGLPGIVGRCSDANNLYLAQLGGSGSGVYKKVGGGFTALAGGSALSDGDVMSMAIIGSSITVKKNGTTVSTVTDSALASGTKWGLRSPGANSAAVRFDNFAVA